MELEIVGMPQDVLDRVAAGGRHELSTCAQPVSQFRVSPKRPRLIETQDGIPLRHGAAPQPLDLRKDVPHPVALLAALPQLAQDLAKYLPLRIDESLQIVKIAHGHGARFNPTVS